MKKYEKFYPVSVNYFQNLDFENVCVLRQKYLYDFEIIKLFLDFISKYF